MFTKNLVNCNNVIKNSGKNFFSEKKFTFFGLAGY